MSLRKLIITSTADLSRFQSYCADISRKQPLIQDESVDLVLSNCFLNLVRPEDKEQLFNERFRVLRRGGRAAISDIVSDEDIPEELQRDAEWRYVIKHFSFTIGSRMQKTSSRSNH